MSGFLTTKGGTRYYVRVDGDIWDEDGRKFSRTDKEALDRALQAGAENPDAEITYTTEQEVEVNIAALRQAYANPLNDTDASDEGAPPPLPAVNVTTSSLPNGTVGVAYSQTLQATGGDGGYAWSRLSGSLPGGLSLASSGAITGTPTDAETGSFTVQADDETGNANSTDSQALSITVDATSPVSWEEDWDYADTTAMLAGIHEDSTTGAGSISLLTGLSSTPWGGSKALRCAFLSAGTGADHQVGATLSMGSFASTNQPREIWLQTWCRWSSDWQSNGPASGGGPGHKHMFLFDQRQFGDSRHSLLTQISGSNIQMIIAGNYGTGGTEVAYPGGITTALFDGTWKSVRLHAKMDNTTGVWEATIDGNSFSWGTGGDNDLGASNYYTYIALSRNINNGVFTDQELDFGPVRVYTNDPGWTF